VGLAAGRNLASNVQVRFLAGSNDVSDLTEDIAIPFGGTAPEKSAFRSRGYRRSAEGRVAFFLPKEATLTVGSSYEREHENSSNESGAVGGPAVETDAFEASRHTIAYYSELLGNLTERFSYTVSGRLDDNSDYDQFRTYRLGANAALVPAVRLRASLSTAFNAPAFNQLRPTLYTVGSPDLRPERISSAEIGLVAGFRRGLIQLSASYFAQRFSDLIQYVNGGPPDFKGSYANLTAATSNGYEAELEISPVRNWRGSASFTIVNPRVTQVDPAYQGGSQVGDALIRRPSHSGSVVLSYARPSSASFGASVNFVGRRPDLDFAQFPSPRVTLPAYAKLDLSAELPLAGLDRSGLSLNARLENALDKRYEDVLHYAAPGRTILIGLRATTLF
jgi:vitamin B12 transporter